MEIGKETLADIERVSREWPDGIHSCAELQLLEPGRRPCTCGRCPGLTMEQILAMTGVRLCGFCSRMHFKAYPEQPNYPCYQVQCQCWCTTGRD